MEFCEKLRELRKQKGLTQEELAQILCVSRTAISKWESARGYPNLDSLKAMAKFFGVSVDQLLSGDELITAAQEDTKQQKCHLRDMVFGLLDCSVAMFFVLPFFGQQVDGAVQAVSLLKLTQIASYLRTAYMAAVIALVLWGILILALQNWELNNWIKHKNQLSLVISGAATLLFIMGSQPYAATFVFLFLTIKAFMMIKWQ